MDRRVIEEYISILLKSEEWLKARILSYLRQSQNSHFSLSDMKISVSDINETLSKGLKHYKVIENGLIPEWENDPLKQFGRVIAQKNLDERISLAELLLILKQYRQAYLSLIKYKLSASENKSTFSYLTERCFDHFELGIMDEWSVSYQQRKNYEESLLDITIEAEKNKYLTIFKDLFLPLIIIDKKNKILNFNFEASHVFPDFKIGDEVFDWQFESIEKKSDFLNSYRNFLTSKDDMLKIETSLHTPRGKRYFKISIKKFFGINNSFNGSLMMFEDFTEINKMNDDLQKAKSNAEEADRLKTAFLANMSHEIRTPMHAIIGFTELLLNGKYDNKERKEYLELIRRSSNDLFNIIEDLIDISKMESKQLKIKYRDCQPYKLLSGLYPIFHESIKRHGIHNTVQLILSVDADYKFLHIYTDGERLKQVVSNLINNAIKFTDEGFIEYGFNLIGKDQLLFFVRDTGSGIPENLKDKIFDRFYQLEEHQNRNHSGAGLGLAICKNIASLLGGKIWMESALNKGSCFYLQIPLRDVPEELRSKSFTQVKNENIYPNWSEKRILVAEDDQINFIYIQEVLTCCGAKVIHAKNGIEAIEITETESKIDLILMDIKMPEIDGLEASRYITKSRPEVPIIALTAFAMEGDKSKCLKAGCVDYLSKPIDKEKLYFIVDKYIHLERTNLSHNIVKMK